MSAKSTDHPSSSRSAEPNQQARRSKPHEDGDSAAEAALPAGLYLVATPIGNLGDITLRAIDVLRRVDRIACEDTRTTRKLLNAHGIDTATSAYHDHSGERARAALLREIKAGAAIALVSDAGTPLVSDPGFKLVREALAADISVTSLPGASAPTTALLLSGLPSDRFFFGGFLPPKTAARRKTLQALRNLDASLLFFETAPRLAASLSDMAAVLGPRQAAVARELTKLHEELRRDSLEALARHYDSAGPPKGEIVIVVAPADPAQEGAEAVDLDAQLVSALAQASLRDAAATVAAASGLPRRQVYARALEISKRGEISKKGEISKGALKTAGSAKGSDKDGEEPA